VSDTDDVVIGNVRLPYLKLKSTACTRCGAEMISLGGLCKGCVIGDIRKELLRQQSSILVGLPDSFEMRVARDKGKARHIAMIGSPRLSLCGMELTEAKKNHTWHPISKISEVLLLCHGCKSVLAMARRGGYR
jgi:hypothetical protein